MICSSGGSGTGVEVARRSTAREDGPEVRFGEDASDLFSSVSLDFDLAIFYRAARSTGLLHGSGQALFLWKTDADKPLHHGNSLAAAPGLLPDDVHPPPVLSRFLVSLLAGIGR